MTGEHPPIPMQVKEPPPTTQAAAAGTPSLQPPPAETTPGTQLQPTPQVETVPPTAAEKIPQTTYETAHTQVMGWVGEVDPDKDPEAIIKQANIILIKNKQAPLQPTPEIIGQIVLAQHQERTNRANAAKANLEAAAHATKPEEPPEESREQIQNRIDDAWDKAGTLLVAEADANLWDENATGITDDEKTVRIAAGRWKGYFTAREEYIKSAIDSENKSRIDGGGKALAPQEIDERRAKLIQEINTSPSKINSAQFKFENGKFICCDSDGKTVVDQFSPTDLVEPTRTFIKELINRKDADSKPTPQAKEAQSVSQVLEKYYKNGAFPARTESELRVEKRTSLVTGNVEDGIKERIQNAKSEKDGKNLIPDEILIGDEMLLGIYLSLDPKTHQTARENIMAQLHRRLIQRNPELFRDNPDMQVLVKRIQAIDTEIQKWLTGIDPHRAHNIPEAFRNNPVSLLAFISTCRRAGLIVQEPGKQPHLTERGADFFAKIIGKSKLEPDDTSFILTLATDENTDYADTFLSKHFGVNTETISDPKKRAEYVDLVMRDMEASGKITKEEMAIMRKISEQQISEVNLEKLAKKFGLPVGASGLLLIFALFAGSINDLMNTGVSAGERGREGG